MSGFQTLEDAQELIADRPNEAAEILAALWELFKRQPDDELSMGSNRAGTNFE